MIKKMMLRYRLHLIITILICLIFPIFSAQELLHPLEQLKTQLTHLKKQLEQSKILTPDEIYKKKFLLNWNPSRQHASNYTQSEAHQSIPEIKTLIDTYLIKTPIPKNLPFFKKYKSLAGSFNKYKNLIDKALAKEKELKNTHYVFYHGMPRIFRITQDLDKAFYNLINPYNPLSHDFIYLRPYNQNLFQLPPINIWLDEKIKKYGQISNYAPDIQPFLLSTNLSFFGNISRPRSFTFRYFIGSFTAKPPPIGRILNILITPFNLEITRKAFFIGILNELYTTIAVKPDNDLLQIFIPKDLVDKYVYLSKPLGIPYDQIDDIKQGFDEERNRYTQISPILKIYENDPQKIAEVIDSLEGRMLLNGEFIRNPKSGLRVLRYTTLDKKIENLYLKRLEILAKYINEESKATVKDNKR